MRLLMVTPSFPPQLNAEAICNGKLALALRDAGVEVTVVTQDPRDVAFPLDPSPCWADAGLEVIALRPRWVDRAPRPVAGLAARLRARHPMTSRFHAAAVGPCRRLLAERRFDLVFSPYDGNPVGLELKRAFGRPWVMGINDPYPYCVFPPPYATGRPENDLERRQVEWVRAAVGLADLVVFPSARLADHEERALGISLGGKKCILPHIGWSRPAGPPPPDRLEILHAGTIDPRRVSLDFFAWLRRTIELAGPLRETIRLTFVGRSSPELRAGVQAEGLANVVHFEDPVPYEESLRRMARAHALLLLEARLAEGIFLPSKFCDYAASGRPLLLFSPRPGAVADLVGAGHPGLLGQEEASGVERLGRFLARAGQGADLAEYRVGASAFAAGMIAQELLQRMKALL